MPQYLNRVTVGVRVFCLAVVSFLFAVSGPFGSFQQGDFGERLLYWFVMNAVSLSVALAVKAAVLQFFQGCSFALRESFVFLTTTMIFTPFLKFWTVLAFPGGVVVEISFWLLAVEALMICLSVSVLLYGVPVLISQSLGEAEAPTVVAPIMHRLPDDFEGRILRLEVNDHRVQVVTDKGVFQLRMRFADAVREVEPVEGFATHRSHWVSRDAISHVIVQRGRPVLILCNGDEIPVSRKYQPDLEEAGLI